ncbi:hypothetical protein [Streptomyces sp. NPDC002133]|uniref:hypothetical protein n=1 Tax=Streptomyces sp. NPDC002133 TaxID=3154409 RepID=UPI0033240771
MNGSRVAVLVPLLALLAVEALLAAVYFFVLIPVIANGFGLEDEDSAKPAGGFIALSLTAGAVVVALNMWSGGSAIRAFRGRGSVERALATAGVVQLVIIAGALATSMTPLAAVGALVLVTMVVGYVMERRSPEMPVTR